MTGEEMERAIDFLLKNQANFDARAEKTDQQIEQTRQQIEQTRQQIEQTNQQIEQTNQQIEQTNQIVKSLGETQTEFMQTMLHHVEAQGQINADTRQGMSEIRQTIRELVQAQQRTQQDISNLAEAQHRTQQDISDLTKVVGNLIKFSSGNGNPPQE